NLLNVKLSILNLNVLRFLNLLFKLVGFLLFLNPKCLASISRWITASSSWKRFCLYVCRVFFFSSRRRHTRLQGDWSSDVCSSDLGCGGSATSASASGACRPSAGAGLTPRSPSASSHARGYNPVEIADQIKRRRISVEIGRASCRERGQG